MFVAVLTGDLVGSTVKAPCFTDAAMVVVEAAANDIASWIGVDTRFTRFRGDGWQIVMPLHAELALRAAIMIFARLKGRNGGLVTRISIGVGTAVHLGSSNLSDAAGEAFVLSGKGLDALGDAKIGAEFVGNSEAHRFGMALLDPMLMRWTREQAEVVSLSLHPAGRNQHSIARTLGISPQAVSLRLKGASGPVLMRALRHWEACF